MILSPVPARRKMSNELNRFVLYSEQAIAETEHESPEEALLAREERITSAIHIANTLKSVNDTSLSDWRGVIGEELDHRLGTPPLRHHT